MDRDPDMLALILIHPEAKAEREMTGISPRIPDGWQKPLAHGMRIHHVHRRLFHPGGLGAGTFGARLIPPETGARGETGAQEENEAPEDRRGRRVHPITFHAPRNCVKRAIHLSLGIRSRA